MAAKFENKELGSKGLSIWWQKNVCNWPLDNHVERETLAQEQDTPEQLVVLKYADFRSKFATSQVPLIKPAPRVDSYILHWV